MILFTKLIMLLIFKTKKLVGLTEIRECIKKAKIDDNIKGIYLPLSVNNNGYATLEAIRAALIDFKKRFSFQSLQ